MAVRDLRGQRVLITGASSGVGCATAEAFARAGSHVALLARSGPGLDAVADRVREHGVEAHAVACDIGRREQVEGAVREAVERLGGLDVVVSNAAAMVYGHFVDVRPEDFDRTIDVTFTGAVDVIRAALPHLERSGGAIVATGSIMARVPLPTFCSYAAAKHALRGFLGSLRVELLRAGSRVSVSMVHPGPIDTPLWHRLSSSSGRSPRNPPDLYSPETIATAIVACARRPRREVIVGFEAVAIDRLFEVCKPVADRVLALVDVYYSSGRKPAPLQGGLYSPGGTGSCSGGLHGRPSLLGAIRFGRNRRAARVG
jgi:NAD(P)-dependent dehydrogenase (short-subunit alcohol dehydrogenase family)